MSERLPADRLLRALDACVRRVRRRRMAVAATTAGVSLAAIGAAAAAWGTLGPFIGLGAPGPRASVVLRVAALALAVGLVVRSATRGVSRAHVARTVDDQLGLADRIAAATAVLAGAAAGGLGDRVVADAAERLSARDGELASAFPARPPRYVGWMARGALVLICVWLGLVGLSHLVPAGDRGLPVAGVVGELPLPGGGEDSAERDAEPETDPDAAPESVPDEVPDAPAGMDDPEPEPDDEPVSTDPLATVSLTLSARDIGPREDVLAIVKGEPAPGLTARRELQVRIELDGEPIETDESVVLSPADASGDHAIVRLRTLADAVPLLTPGEHEVVAVLTPADGRGPEARSAPQRFRVRAEGEGGGAGGEQTGGGTPPPTPNTPPPTPPEPQPEPQPEAQPEAGPEPTAGGGGEDPPPEADPLELPETTQLAVVVPLFGEGDEVEKTGKRLVLEPGGGPAEKPRSVPLVEALPEARRRAEGAVDRANVRAVDRALVRRYFERLRRLAERAR